MNNSEMPAMPLSAGAMEAMEEGWGDTYAGLTKREYFAAKAMQGMLATRDYIGTEYAKPCAKFAVTYADALLAELEK